MCQVYGLRGICLTIVCVLSDLTCYPSLVEGESHGILLLLNNSDHAYKYRMFSGNSEQHSLLNNFKTNYKNYH